MNSWQQFEDDCYFYLNRKYSINRTQFIKFGSADSTLPDIKVYPPNHAPFFIEIKESNAQCGQFVLIPDEDSNIFLYSDRNKSALNQYSAKIIAYMNKNFTSFNTAGTRGQPIDLPKQIFYDWIMNYYSSKNVKFFITKESDFIIFPLEKFYNYFDVSATYRMKKSGSANPSNANQKEVIQLLCDSSCDFSHYSNGKSLYIHTSENLNNEKVIGNKYAYMFKEAEKSIYKVRQLSNTCNSNVIFSIRLKQLQNIKDLSKFESAIR